MIKANQLDPSKPVWATAFGGVNECDYVGKNPMFSNLHTISYNKQRVHIPVERLFGTCEEALAQYAVDKKADLSTLITLITNI